MATTSDIEAKIGELYKNVPHLPKDGQKWLADNVWWLALIGAILSVIGLLGIIPVLLSSLAAGSFVMSYTNVATGYDGTFWLSLLIGLISYVFTTVLLVLSVSPLKVQAKRGWELLFWSYLINFGLAAVSAVVSLAVLSLVSAIISALIGGYFLYEIRSHFVAKHSKPAKEAKVVKKTAK